MIKHILNGLGPNFNLGICSINNPTDEVSIEEVHSQLLSYERFLEHQNKMITGKVHQANLAGGTGSFNNNQGNSSRGKGGSQINSFDKFNQS